MVLLRELRYRFLNKWRRISADNFARRSFVMTASTPYISFTFDDFPRSAFLTGGSLLEKHGVHGTYFVSMGLLNKETPMGRIATMDDVGNLVRDGHELGCHTFDHLDGWSTSSKVFEQSVIENKRVFKRSFPAGHLSVFAYPLNGAGPRTKRIIGRHFLCCRGGGQIINRGAIDLNLLKACFLDWRNRDDLTSVKKLIDKNNAARGWLIFATHDITTQPSKYGCTPEYFAEIVRYAAQSGVRILPVGQTCHALGIVTYGQTT